MCPALQHDIAECTAKGRPLVSNSRQHSLTGELVQRHKIKYDLYSPTCEYGNWTAPRPYMISLDVTRDGESVLTNHTYYYGFGSDSIQDSNREAVGQIFRAAVNQCHTLRAPPCSAIIRAAGECGVPPGVVLYKAEEDESASYCHVLARSANSAPAAVLSAQMTALRGCVPAHVVHTMLAQQDDEGCTPYDRAVATGGDEIAEMFRPPMPKSAAL